ncbi:MAG: hypothetical protein J7L11_03295 [Thermoprotei archaeon]|nr:hypothetical protein [Thermoprotei archaeon]
MLIAPREFGKGKELSEVLINASSVASPGDVVRELIACYLVSLDVIRVKLGEEATKYRTYIKNTMRCKLIGTETIEESADYNFNILNEIRGGYRERNFIKNIERKGSS